MSGAAACSSSQFWLDHQELDQGARVSHASGEKKQHLGELTPNQQFWPCLRPSPSNLALPLLLEIRSQSFFDGSPPVMSDLFCLRRLIFLRAVDTGIASKNRACLCMDGADCFVLSSTACLGCQRRPGAWFPPSAPFRRTPAPGQSSPCKRTGGTLSSTRPCMPECLLHHNQQVEHF